MLFRSRIAVGSFAALVVFVLSASDDARFGQSSGRLLAQNVRRGQAPQGGRTPFGQQPQAQAEQVSGEGTIDGMMGGMLKITLNNEGWLLKFGKGTRVRITGTAELDFLKPGHFVQFNALVDKRKGRLKDPVQKLTIYTISQEYTPGLFEDKGAGAGFGAAPAEAAGEFKPYVVSGRVTAMKGNTLTVFVPDLSPTLPVTLAEGVGIDLNIDDFRFVRPGDKIKLVRATKASMPGQPNMANLTEATITLSQPLGGGQAKKPAVTPTRPGKTEKPAAEEK